MGGLCRLPAGPGVRQAASGSAELAACTGRGSVSSRPFCASFPRRAGHLLYSEPCCASHSPVATSRRLRGRRMAAGAGAGAGSQGGFSSEEEEKERMGETAAPGQSGEASSSISSSISPDAPLPDESNPRNNEGEIERVEARGEGSVGDARSGLEGERAEGAEGEGEQRRQERGEAVRREEQERAVKEYESVVRLKEELKAQLEAAVAQEEYAAAAQLRDALVDAERRDPMRALKSALEEAVSNERYEEASQHQAALSKLARAIASAKLKVTRERWDPHQSSTPAWASTAVASSASASSTSSSSPTSPSFTSSDAASPTCGSNTLTQGVRVRVSSAFLRRRSMPSRFQFLFAYRVSVANEGSSPVKLLNRHWQITSAGGKVDHVRGPGVIGQQPVLPPGGSFEYTSVCPLKTDTGFMEGEFEMLQVDKEEPSTFWAKIGEFGLSTLVEDFEM